MPYNKEKYMRKNRMEKLAEKGVKLDAKAIRKYRESDLTVGQFKKRYNIK